VTACSSSYTVSAGGPDIGPARVEGLGRLARPMFRPASARRRRSLLSRINPTAASPRKSALARTPFVAQASQLAHLRELKSLSGWTLDQDLAVASIKDRIDCVLGFRHEKWLLPRWAGHGMHRASLLSVAGDEQERHAAFVADLRNGRAAITA
jgi:hypothetical protein